MKKISTKEELIRGHLTRVGSAYRKVRLYGNQNKVMQIVGGLVGSAAVLAVVQVIPVFIAAISAAPVIIGIITNFTNIGDKKQIKSHHRKLKVQIKKLCSRGKRID